MGAHVKSVFLLFLFFPLVLVLAPRPGSCHRINVFCWVEGGRITCEAKFTPGGPVKRGRIFVYSGKTGEKLLTAATDQHGRATFDIPEKARKNGWDLKVVCNAEMGHKNFWIVRADEFLPGESGAPPAAGDGAGKTVEKDVEQGSVKRPGPSSRELETVFSRILDARLAPIRRDIAELKEKPVSLQDVLGGLGYIFGMAGVAFYFLGRREKRD